MPTEKEFLGFLLDLEDELSAEERQKFLFMLGDDVPKRMRHAPFVETFTELIERHKISAYDCSYLMDIFERMKLNKLAYKVGRFIAGYPPMTTAPGSATTSNPAAMASNDVQPKEAWISTHGPVAQQSSRIPFSAQDVIDDTDQDDTMVLRGGMTGATTTTTMNKEVEEEQAPPLDLDNIDLDVFENGPWTSEFLQSINVIVRPHEYQRELVQRAIRIGNTLVCLRTGGGKTYVAALLLKYYFIKKMKSSKNDSKKFLAFFFVPRRAILKQQVDALKQVGNLRVAVCHENNDATQYINGNDVIVCTPQKLVNCLKAKTISLSDIDLLCFDECHNAVQQHPYVEIMQYLLCTGFDHIMPVHRPPIIIGLTATIGLRGSNTRPVIHNLSVLCATFNCETITTILKHENEQELEERVSRPSEDQLVCVDKQTSFDPLTLTIQKDLQNLILHLFASHECNPSRIFPDRDLDVNGYEQTLVLLQEDAMKKQDFPTVLLLDYIRAIYRRLQALMDLTPQLILSDLRDYFEKIYQRRENPIETDTIIYNHCQDLFTKKLAKIEEKETLLSNPKLDQVVELLKKHAEKSNSRGLILVVRTFYAKKICDFLQNHPALKDIIKPCWLVGQSGVDYVKSNNEQDSTLKDFRTGKCNVMVSTDVVQEGLDVPECDFVLRYEFVSDSIGTVQARGRARALNSSYYLVTTTDSPHYEKEMENRQREVEMKEALAAWKKMSPDVFKKRVSDQQELLLEKWRENVTKVLSRGTIERQTDFTGDLLCKACSYKLGELAWIRRFGTCYFVVHRRFFDHIEKTKFPVPKVHAKTSQTGKALCGNTSCRAELGGIQILADRPDISPMCALKGGAIKVRQIDIESGKEIIIAPKKWTEMPFEIPLIDNKVPSDSDVFHDAPDSPPVQ